MSFPSQLLLGSLAHLVWLEAKLPLKFLEGRRGAECFHADDAARWANVAIPSNCGALLDGYACCHFGRQNTIAIFLRLVLENVPGRHGDNARSDAVCEQLFVGLYRQAKFAACSNQ